MMTLQEAKGQSIQFRNTLQQLRSDFAELGAALRNAAEEMEKNGVPSDANLQISLEAALADFATQRQKILKFAENCFGLAEKPVKEQLVSIDDLEVCLNSAIQHILRQQKERTLEPLRKAITVSRRKGFFVPQVDDFKNQARAIFEKLQHSDLPEFEKEYFESQKLITAFSAIVDLIEGGEVLDDDQCENLRQSAVKFFEKTLVIAALRGHLFLDRGVATPEFPSFGSSTALAKDTIKPSVEAQEDKEEAITEEAEDKEEPQREPVKAPSQFIGWPQNGWEKEAKEKEASEKEEEKTEKAEEESPVTPTVLEARKLKKGILRPAFTEYKNFSEKCIALEKVLEKTTFHEIIMAAIGQRRIDEVLDFGRLRKPQAEAIVQPLQDWYAMSRDLKATSHEVKSILTACGFEVTEIHQERRHRVGFSATCKLTERVTLAAGYENVLTLGKYRISCFWGNPSEEILIAEANDALPDEISFIFHFGRLTDEHRYELAKICKQGHHKLFILDDILVLHLLSMPNNRLQELFNSILPHSYAEKLSPIRRN